MAAERRKQRGRKACKARDWGHPPTENRRTAGFALKLLSLLRFIAIATEHCVNSFRLCDRWREIDASEAARLLAQARLPRPPPVKAIEPKPARPASSTIVRSRAGCRHWCGCRGTSRWAAG
jgi:hypothetical protein